MALRMVLKLDELIDKLSPADVLLGLQALLERNQHLVDGVAVIHPGDIGRGNRFLDMLNHLRQCLLFLAQIL
jgi:hypothetical protein